MSRLKIDRKVYNTRFIKKLFDYLHLITALITIVEQLELKSK